MKTGKDLFCKVSQSPRLPRVVVTPNLQHGRQDPSNLEARTSADHQSEQSAKYEEIRLSHLEDTRRKHLEENHRRSSRKRVAVMLITDSRYILSTVEKEDLIEKKSKKTHSTVRESPEQ